MSSAPQDTKQRILDAAWDIAAEMGLEKLSVGDVAARAGLSRQAVYLHFRNRARMLTEMARRHDERSGLNARIDRIDRLDPIPALEGSIRLWLEYIPTILPVARALEAAAIRGEEGVEAWQDRMDALLAGLRSRVAAVSHEGALRSGWTIDEATDWLYARLSVSTWHTLVVERGWAPKKVTERLVTSVRAELLAANTDEPSKGRTRRMR